VERILATKKRKGKSRKYLIRWEGFSPTHNLWQSEKDLSNVSNLVKQFWSNRKSKAIILPQKMDLKEKSQKIPQKLSNKKDSGRFRKRKL
jgi:hypothetical protein